MTTQPDTTACTNADLGKVLGLTHSAVSRMRSGERIGSIETLSRLAAAARVPLEDVVVASRAARAGDLTDWTRILDAACSPPA